MPNILKQGAEWLSETMAESASENVVYYRNGQAAVVNIPIVRGFPDRDLEQLQGITQTESVFDWILNRDQIPALGDPQNGDVIQWGASYFEANALGSGQDCWRPADEFQIAVRIHAKQISKPGWLTADPTYTGVDRP